MASIWVKYGILVSYLVTVVIFGALIAFFGPFTCTRSACVRKAKYIISNMDSTISPCENFYQFACGNFNKTANNSNFLNKYAYVSPLIYIQRDINKILNDFLKTPPKITDDRILKIIKKMYQPCVDVDIINQQGVQPIWDAVWMVGGFPVVDGDDWDEEGFSIGTFEYKSRKSGFRGQHIFKSYVSKDLKKPGSYSIYISPPKVSTYFPGQELVSGTVKVSKEILDENYLSFIVRLTFHLLGKDNYEHDEELKETRIRYINELQKTLSFKVELNNILKSYWTEQDPVNLYNSMTLDNLESQFPYIDWKNFFKNMLPITTKMPNKIIVKGTSYFKGINNLLQVTPKRTVANFLMLENVFEGSLFLPSNFFAVYNKFRSNIQLESAQRQIFCEEVVKKTMKGVLSSLFVQRYNLTEGTQPVLEGIAKLIKQEIRKSIEVSKWMDDKSKESAILKLKTTKLTLSLSDDQLLELRDVEARAKYYEELCLGRRASHVLPSYFCINKFFSKRNWELLSRTPTVFDDYDVNVFALKITYDQDKNRILVPYGLLKYPIFDEAWPNYLNFGGIGSALGAGFTNGYDLTGGEFNYLGFHSKWWTANTSSHYNRQIQCSEDNYKGYIAQIINKTITIRNREQLSREISEFDGVNLAYKAYSEYYEGRYVPEENLPGLETYNNKQLFFIGFANIYCTYQRAEKIIPILRHGITNDFKVMESLMGLEDFSKAFGCKLGNKMSPKKKCKTMF